MSAPLNLFIDISANSLVKGITNPLPASLPPLVQGDILNLNVYLLQPTGQLTPPYSVLGNQGVTLEMAIGDKFGDVTNYYATQFAWTADPGGQFFTASFSLNTAAITTLLGHNATQVSTFEVKFIIAGVPTTCLEIPCTVNAAVIKPGGAQPAPAGQNLATVEYVNGTFLSRQNNGFVLVSPNGLKKAFVWIDNDGAFHTDPVN